LEQVTVTITASFGVALVSNGRDSKVELVRMADQAMYRVKTALAMESKVLERLACKLLRLFPPRSSQAGTV
jgi:GGDEF domain-containing protein